MKNEVISVLGAGNLGLAVLAGLIKQDYPRNRLFVTRRDPEALLAVQKEYPGIHALSANEIAAANADVIIIAVKPKDVQSLLRSISSEIEFKSKKPLFISLAAGVKASDMTRWLGYDAAIVRCMTNTPALIGQGASVLFANESVTKIQQALATELLASISKTCWVDTEEELNNIMPLVSCGPGYIFFIMEEYVNAAVRMGIPHDIAEAMTKQMVLGSATLASSSSMPLEELRRQVTTPGGVTHQGIVKMEEANLGDLFERAMVAGVEKGAEYAVLFGRD